MRPDRATDHPRGQSELVTFQCRVKLAQLPEQRLLRHGICIGRSLAGTSGRTAVHAPTLTSYCRWYSDQFLYACISSEPVLIFTWLRYCVECHRRYVVVCGVIVNLTICTFKHENEQFKKKIFFRWDVIAASLLVNAFDQNLCVEALY